MTLETIIGFVVPVASIALTYIVGRMQSTHSDKKAADKEAYEAFFVPFISLLYESQIWNVGFSRLDRKSRHKLFQLVASNIRYMDEAILDSVDVLYGCYEAIMLKEDAGVDSLLTHDRTDEIFDDLTTHVLSRSTQLAHKLNQPHIGEFALERYREGQAVRKKQPQEATQAGVRAGQ